MRPRRGSEIYRLSVNGSKSFFITAVKFSKAEAADKYPAGELPVKFYARYLEKLLPRRARPGNYDFYYCLNNFLSSLHCPFPSVRTCLCARARRGGHEILN